MNFPEKIMLYMCFGALVGMYVTQTVIILQWVIERYHDRKRKRARHEKEKENG